MPKRVPEEAKRVALNCLVLPETLDYLKSAPGSQGSVVDRAVAALRTQIAQNREVIELRDLRRVSDVDKFEQRRAEVHHAQKVMRQTQRGPRQKGDKTR